MSASDIISALRQIARERDIDPQALVSAVETAMEAVYERRPDSWGDAEVRLDPVSGELSVWASVGVNPQLQEWIDGGGDHDDGWVDVTPEDFSRTGAAVARSQMSEILARLEDEQLYATYSRRIGEVVTGIVRQADFRKVLLDIGHVDAILPRSEMERSEHLRRGMRVSVAIKEVKQEKHGLAILVSRTSPDLIAGLMRLEVPEIDAGYVTIDKVVRHPGVRTKLLVSATSNDVDPVSACIGHRGQRIRQVMRDVRSRERIDIVNAADNPRRQITRALAPARIREVRDLDTDARSATVVVGDDQLSEVLGPKGANARLAATLLGWSLDVVTDSALAQRASTGEDDTSGRCTHVRENGRRCANHALAGGHLCDIHSGA